MAIRASATPDEIHKVCKLYKEGVLRKYIGQRLDLHYATVCAILKEAELSDGKAKYEWPVQGRGSMIRRKGGKIA